MHCFILFYKKGILFGLHTITAENETAKIMRQTKGKTVKSVRQEKKTPTVKVLDHNALDTKLCDLVLHSLYDNAHKSVMNLENEIFEPNHVKLPIHESQRIWNVLMGSGWVNPCIGFGNAGKIGLSKAGYQLMVQFGGYKQFLDASGANA